MKFKLLRSFAIKVFGPLSRLRAFITLSLSLRDTNFSHWSRIIFPYSPYSMKGQDFGTVDLSDQVDAESYTILFLQSAGNSSFVSPCILNTRTDSRR